MVQIEKIEVEADNKRDAIDIAEKEFRKNPSKYQFADSAIEKVGQE